MDLITESLGIMMSGEQEIPDVPDGYEQLDYIVCPSFSAQAGFRISETIPSGTIIDFISALSESTNSEVAFGGNGSGYTYEFYYETMKCLVWGSTAKDMNNISGTNAQINTPYRFIGQIQNANPSGLNIGYYDVGRLIFKGRIYKVKVYNFANMGVGDTENVLYELYPAKRKSDNKVGMYERVNGVFYPSTTGTDFQAPTAE